MATSTVAHETSTFEGDDQALVSAFFEDEPETPSDEKGKTEIEDAEIISEDDNSISKPDDEKGKAAKGDTDTDTDTDEDEDDEGEGEKDVKPKDGEEMVFTVKDADGKEVEVGEQELVAGWYREADYTRKMQAHSAEVNAWETERDTTRTELTAALSYYALPTAKEPNPAEYEGRAEEFQKDFQAFTTAKSNQEQAATILEGLRNQEMAETVERETKLLYDAVPEWKDNAVKQTDFAKMGKFGVERYGFTQEELSGATDHRLLLLLRDAARVAEFDNKAVILKRSTRTAKKLAPGTKVTPDPANNGFEKAVKSLENGEKADPTSLFFTD